MPGNRTPSQDEEHLRLLVIFHFVVAGVAALFALFPLLHLVMGIAIVSGAFETPDSDPLPSLIGWFFVVFAGVWIVLGLLFAICLAMAGHYLRQRRHYLYCLVMAGVACIFMPFGTVLGVFTILVLMRETVKQMFERTAEAAPPG